MFDAVIWSLLPSPQEFLNTSQLTYHGLAALHEGLQPGALAVFFRNNHFNVLTKVTVPTATHGACVPQRQLLGSKQGTEELCSHAHSSSMQPLPWRSRTCLLLGAPASFRLTISCRLRLAEPQHDERHQRRNLLDDAQHMDGALYLLMSDQGYLREPHVVWERLSGIDGDTAFYKARSGQPRLLVHP